MTYYDLQRIIGVETTTEILNAPDAAARCKAAAAAALLDDRERDMRAWIAFRKMVADGEHLLACGTVARLGLRVVRAAPCTRDMRMHVNVITSLDFLDCGTVDCGPSQLHSKGLRAAPPSANAPDDLEEAARWLDVILRENGTERAQAFRAEARALRAEQAQSGVTS